MKHLSYNLLWFHNFTLHGFENNGQPYYTYTRIT